MSPLALAPLLACAWASDISAAPRAASDRSYGVLLIGEGGDLNWKAAVAAIKKELTSKGRAFEFAQGPADAKEIQRAVDRIQDRGVKKLVVVPLYLSSFSDVVDEDRYLFGIREKPPAAFAAALKSMGARVQARLKVKVPVVMTRALDDSDALVDLLAARARSQSREPARETLILVGEAPNSPEALRDWTTSADALAEKVRQKAGLRGARAAALREGLDHKTRDSSEAEVHKLVATLASQGPAIVLPLELSQGVVHIRLPRALEGAFARYESKPLLPDPKLADWVKTSAEAAAKLPDMRVFKDSGPSFSAMKPASKLDFGSKPNAHGGH